MKITEWFNNGCNYDEGVAIYASLKDAKPNLLSLFKKKNSSAFLEKLKYELSKHKESKETFTILIAQKEVTKINIITPESNYKPLRVSDFPMALHPVYLKKKQDFGMACSLKMQLNNLPDENEEEALKMCLEIDRLFDAIELAWKQLDHYSETKSILNVVINDFQNLTPAQHLQRRNQLRSNRSKAIKRLEILSKTEAKTISEKTKLEINTEKMKTKITQLDNDIEELTKLIEDRNGLV